MKKLLFTFGLLFSFSLSWGQIVSNGNFETWTGNTPDDWTTIDSGITTSKELTDIHGGSASASIEVTTGTQSNTDIRQSISVVNGHEYNISVWVKHTEGYIKARLYIDGYQGYSDNTNTSTWQEITYTYTANSSSIEIGLRFYDQSGFDGSEIVYVDDFVITDTSTTPTITTSTSSLTGFNYIEGNGPSAEQSFTVEGSNLTDDITVTPPSNWEISTTSGSGFQTSAITLTQSGGTVNSTTIYTRMVAGLTNANSPFSGNIACESTDATTQNIAVDGTVDAAIAEISVEGNNVEILDGDTTPDTADHTDFGNVEVTGGSQAYTFTIKNTGNADLTVNSISSDNVDFAISGTTSGTITAGNSIDFTITFDPSATGTSTATITIDNDDSDESTYDFLVQGNGTNSTSSDIITNTGFAYTVNIPYLDYQNDPITSTSGSVGVFKFDIRDGGGSADADALSTELTDITFSVGAAHGNYIRSAALFDGNTQLANNPTIDNATGNISFSGLSGTDYTATDDNTKSLTLRVSFTTTVTDKEQLQFTITSATANNNGSVFATADAGGAQSAVTGDKNRIDVIADRIRFTTHPGNGTVNTNLDSFTVSAMDINSNKDLDANNDISLTTSGVGMTHNSPYTMVNGEISITDVQFNATQNAITITATTTGLAFDNDDVSNSFDILDVTIGSYRTTGDGTWKSTSGGTASWEEYTSSGWTAMSDQPADNTSNPVFIRHSITLQGTNTASDITIENGGILDTDGVSQTITELLVKTGGTYFKNSNGMKVATGGTIEVEDGGTFKFKHTDGTSLSTNLWNGTEKFHADSNFILVETDNTADFQFMENPTDVSDFNGGQFGNLIVDLEDGKLMLLPDNYNNTLTKGDLVFKKIADNIKFTATDATCTIKGNLEIQSTIDIKNITITTKEKTVTLTVEGNFIHNGSKDFRLANSSGIDPNITLNIYGNLELTGTSSKLRPDINSNGTGTNEINLKGDLTVNSGSILYSENIKSVLNFTGSYNEASPDSIQTIDIASTDGNENKNIQFNVNSGAYVQIINQDFELGKDAKLTIKDGGIFDFGFDGNTALKVTKSGSQTGTAFDLDAGGYLKITSPDGIMSNSSAGNVQVVASNTTFSPIATFHYIGKANQMTGDAIGSSSNGRAVIVEMTSNSLSLTPSQSFGITNAAHTNINGGNGGILEIRKGKFVETDTEYVTGSTGGLKMTDGTYIVVKNTANSSDYIPRMEGLNNAYDLTGGTIELAGDGSQILRGGRNYRNLTFSNAGIKTISSAVPNINGMIYITDDVLVNVENKSFGGGAQTDLMMDTNAIYKTAGTGTKPDAGGDYLLDTNTKIIFTNTESSTETIRLGQGSPIEYANIDIEGNNVSNNSLSTGIRFQSGGTFTVKTNATFKLNNTTGFNGGTETAIDNTNTPTITLETGSTIEYTGSTQSISNHTPGYQNLIISGTDTKTLGDIEILVNENLSVNAATLSVEDDKSIKIAGNITNDGAILIANKGGLVQTDDNASISGTGTFQLNKTSLPLNNYWEYVYWSSPINSSTFTMGDIVSGAWRYYKYDPNAANNGHLYPGWVMLSATDTPAKGIGYAISAPTGAAVNTILNPQFISGNDPFNNGVISVPIIKRAGTDGDMNLIGNPYPSAIDFNAFANVNTDIDGSYSLWTNCAGLSSNAHQTSGYTTYAVSGTNTAACSSSGGAVQAGQYIATGQGFVVLTKASANVGDDFTAEFKNAYRVSNNNDGFLNRSTQNDIVWIDMMDNNQHFNQIAVGFYQGATNHYDRLFDAKNMNVGSGFALYSIVDNERVAIQGLPELASIDKVIPLGVESDIARTITLHINHTEGLADEYIYVRDLYLNTIHDLKASDYTTTVNTGNIDNRFELIFTQQAMRIDNIMLDPNAVLLTQQSGAFTLVSSNEMNITSITVYDITGKVLYNNKDIDATSHQIDLQQIATGNMLIFRIQMNHKSFVIKKAIKQ